MELSELDEWADEFATTLNNLTLKGTFLSLSVFAMPKPFHSRFKWNRRIDIANCILMNDKKTFGK